MKEKVKQTKKVFIFISVLIFTFLVAIHVVKASTLSCWDVDGMAIFGYKYGEWKFIGAIANEFDSDSIANEFGAGNEFSSDSIFNEFGSFGSEFSSYSAFNEFANNPPIIVNDNYKFVGYLTINEFKTPNINTYEAIACAKKSFRSFSNYDLKDITFKNIPKSSGYSDYPDISQQEIENLLKSLCPPNSQYLNGQCICNEGFVASGSICITYTQNCQLKYGLNSYGDKNYCYCSLGYEFNSTKTACVKSITCPLNSTKINNVCVCNEGYIMKDNVCITINQYCQNLYGANSYGVGKQCYCSTGYEFDSSRNTCVKSVICPLNSTKINNICVCNEGYIMRNNNCITYTEDCIREFGQNVYGTKGTNNSNCYCNEGYEWNSSRTACVKIESKEINIVQVEPSLSPEKLTALPQDTNKEKEENLAGEGKQVQEQNQQQVSNEQKPEQKKPFFMFLASIFDAIKNFFSQLFK